MQVGQDRALRLHPRDPFQRLLHVGVGRVRRGSAARRRSRPRRPPAPRTPPRAGRPRRWNRPRRRTGSPPSGSPPWSWSKVDDRDRRPTARRPPRARRAAGRSRVSQMRRIAALALEDVAEPRAEGRPGGRVHVAGRCAAALAQEEGAQVVDAVRLVGVVVGVEHRVDALHARGRRLQPQVRRGVDQHRGLSARSPAIRRTSREQRRAAVPRLGRIAGAPVAVGARHAARGAAAQDGELQRAAHRGLGGDPVEQGEEGVLGALLRPRPGVQPRISASLASTWAM